MSGSRAVAGWQQRMPVRCSQLVVHTMQRIVAGVSGIHVLHQPPQGWGAPHKVEDGPYIPAHKHHPCAEHEPAAMQASGCSTGTLPGQLAPLGHCRIPVTARSDLCSAWAAEKPLCGGVLT